MMMSMKVSKVEVKTANFLESWAGAITLLVTGLVKLKHYPVRKRFAQNIVLAPKEDGYFIFSDIFKLICDEYDDQYPFADYNCADNMPQVEASYTMAEIGISFNGIEVIYMCARARVNHRYAYHCTEILLLHNSQGLIIWMENLRHMRLLILLKIMCSTKIIWNIRLAM